MPLSTIFSIILLLWSGMILGISLEASVKFKTPSLDKAVGLDVGRTVFRAFHYVQWGLFAILFLGLLFAIPTLSFLLLIISIGVLLGIQSIWLFPHLCANVERILTTGNSRTGPYHTLYAAAEIIKFFLLLASGIYSIVTYHPSY